MPPTSNRRTGPVSDISVPSKPGNHSSVGIKVQDVVQGILDRQALYLCSEAETQYLTAEDDWLQTFHSIWKRIKVDAKNTDGPEPGLKDINARAYAAIFSTDVADVPRVATASLLPVRAKALEDAYAALPSDCPFRNATLLAVVDFARQCAGFTDAPPQGERKLLTRLRRLIFSKSSSPR